MTNRRVAAKKVLDGAKKYAGKDVVVVSNDKEGNVYLASSMPSGSSQQLQAQITLVNEGLKVLRRIHRKEQRRERAVAREKAA